MDTSSLKAAAKPQQNSVATQQQNKPLTPARQVQALLSNKERMSEIEKALPKNYSIDRFIRIVMTAISSNPKLAQACVMSPNTFLGALYNAAQTGLEPNTPLGKAYLLPYNSIDKNTGKKVAQVQFQIGYLGYIDLAFRSGRVKSISAEVRYKKDFWEYEKGINEKLRHIPYDEGDPGEAVGYYAVIHMKDTVNPDGTTESGAVITAYMPKFRALEHAKRFSKSYDRKKGTFSGPWATDFDSMALKTVLLKALKYAPKATEDSMLAKAFTSDSTIRDGTMSNAPTIKTEGVFDANSGDGVIEAEVVEADEEEGIPPDGGEE